MKVKQIKEWLSQFEDEEELLIVMDHKFECEDFELRRKYADRQAQEVIIPYFEEYRKEGGGL